MNNHSTKAHTAMNVILGAVLGIAISIFFVTDPTFKLILLSIQWTLILAQLIIGMVHLRNLKKQLERDFDEFIEKLRNHQESDRAE